MLLNDFAVEKLKSRSTSKMGGILQCVSGPPLTRSIISYISSVDVLLVSMGSCRISPYAAN